MMMLAFIVLATVNNIPTEVQPIPGGGGLSVAEIITAVINFILQFAAALAVLMIVLGGIRYITSAGNEDALKQGRNIVLYAIIGLVIIILSFVIVNFILTTTPVIVPPQ